MAQPKKIKLGDTDFEKTVMAWYNELEEETEPAVDFSDDSWPDDEENNEEECIISEHESDQDSDDKLEEEEVK
ncbi:unnamed protein product [Acanthoscelides obtectus]|uniref:Uncharacterized protein n=1 Tax=Acanthoscelides obtectus TaxID=200917 RepID=A0A9P0KXF4_ACAOB|nr:unnamed protein product [Acanthoscelides obtectus]CAK1634428.1 hypothetical protein AOBTE_LOCUS8753 [Acanthoscelides obtectus]